MRQTAGPNMRREPADSTVQVPLESASSALAGGTSMGIMIVYSVAGSALWALVGVLGAGLGVQLIVALAGPPAVHLAFLMYRR